MKPSNNHNPDLDQIADMAEESPRRLEGGTVFLTASGRSGSTWLQNMLTASGEYRIMFEPFFPRKTRALSGWKNRQYIMREDVGEHFREAAQLVLDGAIRNGWIDQDNKSDQAEKLFIKDIRTNMCIAWLKAVCPHMGVVLLLRHPFDVAKSRTELGWGAHLEWFLEQDSLMRHHFPDDRKYLESISTPFGQQVAFWAVENLVALRELESDDGAVVVSYEDLLEDPRKELGRITSFLKMSHCNIPDKLITKRSKTSSLRKMNGFEIDDDALEEGMGVLAKYKLDGIYSSDSRDAPKLSQRDLLSEFQLAE